MKICHFIASSKFGGAERVVINLCNELSKHHHVHFVTFDRKENLKGLNETVEVHTLREFKRYNIFAMFKLAQLIKRLDIDILHTHGAKSARIMHSINYFFSIPTVSTKHNARKGRIFNKLPYVTAVSQEVAKSITHDRVKVIYNGIVPQSVKESHRKNKEVPLFLAIGRLDPIKGFDILIEACSRIQVPFRLQIVGEGKEKKRLEELIGKYDLGSSVELLGFREDIPQLMSDADCVVMSSHSEGFSLVMVEALFYANAFLSTKVSGATEILPKRFLTDQNHLYEKLTDFVLDKKKYIQEYQILKKRLQPDFLLSHIAKEYETYYIEVLEQLK